MASLPAGPYVAVIRAVKLDGQEPNKALILRVDVSEGEHAGYFQKRYDNDKERSKGNYEVRYKGDFKLWVPVNDDESKQNLGRIRDFNDAIFKLEKDNPGYHWDWNEQGLVGLTVGINMQEREYNGMPFTAIGRLESAEDVRAGIVAPMRPKQASTVPNSGNDGYTKVEEELPWDDKPKAPANPWF